MEDLLLSAEVDIVEGCHGDPVSNFPSPLFFSLKFYFTFFFLV
uniref:Uncharacterized protein n=1 Tax=Rhizophora mucronata TaxID=61149 RepID=A0A2P2M4L4_RHIMU